MIEKLRQIIADVTGLPLAEIGENASMAALSEWDSVAHLNIVMSIEREFGVKISAGETLSLTSLPAILDVVRTRTSG